MQKNYKARGIVLHTVKYGESSLVAYLFTDLSGRQTYMVQGVRSKRSKGNKGALFQPMFVVEFEGYRPPHAQMHRIRECRNFLPLGSTPFDARKSTISLFMAEILYKLIKEEESNPPLFEFILDAVGKLDAMESGVANFHLWFLVNLSYYLGFYPGNEYREGDLFDLREGLFIAAAPAHGDFMSGSCSRLMSQLMEAESGELDRIRIPRTLRGEFMESMLAYFGYHFDSIRSARSIAILKEVF